MKLKIKDNDKTFWQLNIAFLTIILFVLTAGIIIILVQGGHLISGKEIVRDTTFPWIVFIPIWLTIIKKKHKPTKNQEEIIGIMLKAGLILLVINVLVFFIL